MFMVINKDKIISYVVSFSTVAILFTMSFVMTRNSESILETSTNVVKNAIEANNTGEKKSESQNLSEDRTTTNMLQNKSMVANISK